MILGVLILVPDSGLLRLIGGDPFVVAFWRGVGTCVVIWIFSVVHSPAEFVEQLIKPSWLSAGIIFAFGFSSLAFVIGVAYLGAATMLIFVSITPLSSAVASLVLFGEKTDRALWLAIIFGISGALIAGSAIPSNTPIEGFLAGLMVPVLTGLGISLTRHFPGKTIWPLYGLANCFVALVLFILLPSLSPPPGTEYFLVINACIVVPLSFALITIAPKYLPAPEVGLYLLLETLIGPLIVWLLVDEAPRLADYIGGLILITALVCLFSYRMKTANRLTHHY